LKTSKRESNISKVRTRGVGLASWEVMDIPVEIPFMHETLSLEARQTEATINIKSSL
jgi:5-carboxymethyl-2-hydroxymuconate isomerase